MTTQTYKPRRVIADDEVALAHAGTLRAARKKLGLTGRELAARIGGITAGIISALELRPDRVSWHAYNKVAEVLHWPLYVPGRKRNPPADNSGEVQSQSNIKGAVLPKGQIDFAKALEVSPEEGIIMWIDSLDDKLRSDAKILADFYETTLDMTMLDALKEYITKRRPVIDIEKKNREFRAEQRRRLPR